jgi:epoxyqueuosine reductase
MSLTDEVKSCAVNFGVDLVGVAPVERFQDAPAEAKPQYYMRDAKCVVVLATRILRGICDVHGSFEEEGKTIGPYSWYGYPVLNWSFSWAAVQAGKLLEDNGYKAIPIPPQGYQYRHEGGAPDFYHKHAAVAAGLGELGLNRLFLSPQFGAHQRLLSIITNAPLDPDPMYSGPKLCNREECRDTCVKLCPMKAFIDKLMTVKIGGREYQHLDFDITLCTWNAVVGKYLRGTDELPRYPTHQQIDEIIREAGGRAKLQEKMNSSDISLQQYARSPTCGTCLTKCRAPWN